MKVLSFQAENFAVAQKLAKLMGVKFDLVSRISIILRQLLSEMMNYNDLSWRDFFNQIDYYVSIPGSGNKKVSLDDSNQFHSLFHRFLAK